MTRDTERLSESLIEAQASLRGLQSEGDAVARHLTQVFDTLGQSLSDTLETAARSGALSISDMVEDILQSLASAALDQAFDHFAGSTTAPFASLVEGLGTVVGLREHGGPVQAGQSYLVGERGPEVFTPTLAGAVNPSTAPMINLTIQAGSTPLEAVRRSERQIAAAVARAVSRGGALL